MTARRPPPPVSPPRWVGPKPHNYILRGVQKKHCTTLLWSLGPDPKLIQRRRPGLEHKAVLTKPPGKWKIVRLIRGPRPKDPAQLALSQETPRPRRNRQSVAASSLQPQAAGPHADILRCRHVWPIVSGPPLLPPQLLGDCALAAGLLATGPKPKRKVFGARPSD